MVSRLFFCSIFNDKENNGVDTSSDMFDSTCDKFYWKCIVYEVQHGKYKHIINNNKLYNTDYFLGVVIGFVSTKVKANNK